MTSHELEPVAREVCDVRGYRFGSYVNEGTFKVTFHVLDPEDTSLALKIFKPGFSPERTAREIDAMQQFDHPNIGRLLEIGTFSSGLGEYLVAVEEFLAGGTLSERLAGGLLSRNAILQLGQTLINAVDCISTRELVHRDLKPDNIMFRSDGSTPVIVDFGIVRDLTKSPLTHSFLPNGPCTPFFAAPEQLTNTKLLIDWRTDQFALGVLLSVAGSGMHPYAERGDSATTVCDRVARKLKQSRAFVNWANTNQLPALIRMTEPWPVFRYTSPETLIAAWNAQGGSD